MGARVNSVQYEVGRTLGVAKSNYEIMYHVMLVFPENCICGVPFSRWAVGMWGGYLRTHLFLNMEEADIVP